MNNTKHNHWENIYTTKSPEEVSWTQKVPETSLKLINQLNLPKDAAIIDIGGGDSNLVDFLLYEGYTNLTVLDISESALKRAQVRLGDKAKQVTWITSDITEFKPTQTYEVWHDRAAFHFLTATNEVETYLDLVNKFATKNLIIGTFSVDGPLKCSGLPITQYNQELIEKVFSSGFTLKQSHTENHTTPFGTQQNFLFSTFIKK